MDTFDDVLTANAQYAASFPLRGLAAPAARGLGVLTCIDSRIKPLAMLGIEAGDAKIFRNAGAHASDDAIRSLVLATNLLHVRRIMVVAHTDCAMAHTTDDELRARIAGEGPVSDELAAMRLYASPDPHVALKASVERIRTCALIPEDVIVGGFEYDVDSGLLAEIVAS
jgi:carbonic anhydrase